MHAVDRELRRTAELVVNAARIEATSKRRHAGLTKRTLREVLEALPARDRAVFAVELAEMLAAALAAVPSRGVGR